jgi:nitrogen fixation protein NifU and related proteins
VELVHIDNLHLTASRLAKDPRNRGPLDILNGHGKITGPCGDTMEFWVNVQTGKIEKVSFTTTGCAPSLAAGSMTTCLAEGKTVKEAKTITQKDVLDALESLPEDHQHCALLAANTLAAACDDYLTKQK